MLCSTLLSSKWNLSSQLAFQTIETQSIAWHARAVAGLGDDQISLGDLSKGSEQGIVRTRSGSFLMLWHARVQYLSFETLTCPMLEAHSTWHMMAFMLDCLWLNGVTYRDKKQRMAMSARWVVCWVKLHPANRGEVLCQTIVFQVIQDTKNCPKWMPGIGDFFLRKWELWRLGGTPRTKHPGEHWEYKEGTPPWK